MTGGTSAPGSYRPLLSQAAIAVVGMLFLALSPPAQGRMLLIPISGAAAQALPVAALSQGVLLEAAGPLPGSLVVVGNGAFLSGPMLREGVVVVAAPPAGCGSETARPSWV